MNSVTRAPKKDNSKNAPDPSAYYMTLSLRFKTAKFITVVVLILFLLTMVSVFRDEITFDNLRYLLKDLELGDNVAYTVGNTVYFDSDQQTSMKLYKGDLCIAGSSSFVLCDMDGNRLFTEDSVFSNPVLLSGNKYLLAYGLSEKTYRIYNTFSFLYGEELDYPISCCALSDNGYYAVVTRSEGYNSVISVYDPDFELIKRISKADKYVLDVKLNTDGSEILITSVFRNDGELCAEYMTVDLRSSAETPKGKNELANTMPLTAGFYPDGKYLAVNDRTAVLFDKEMYIIKSFDLGYRSPVYASVFDGCTVICYRKNIVGSETQLIFLDSSCNEKFDIPLRGAVKKACKDGNLIYLLMEGFICRVDTETEECSYIEIDDNASELLLVEKDVLIVGYSNRATVISFDD